MPYWVMCLGCGLQSRSGTQKRGDKLSNYRCAKCNSSLKKMADKEIDAMRLQKQKNDKQEEKSYISDFRQFNFDLALSDFSATMQKIKRPTFLVLCNRQQDAINMVHELENLLNGKKALIKVLGVKNKDWQEKTAGFYGDIMIYVHKDVTVDLSFLSTVYKNVNFGALQDAP